MDSSLSEPSLKLLSGSLGFQEIVLYTSSRVQFSEDGSYGRVFCSYLSDVNS